MSYIDETNQTVEDIVNDVERLTEMANLDREETGLPYLIWVGPPPASHGYRIKVVYESGKINPRNSVSISISDEPEIVAGDSSKIPAKSLVKIINWIKANKSILIRHANMEITDRELRSGLVSVSE